MPGQITRSEIDEEISEVRVQGGRRCLGTFPSEPPGAPAAAQLPESCAAPGAGNFRQSPCGTCTARRVEAEAVALVKDMEGHAHGHGHRHSLSHQ